MNQKQCSKCGKLGLEFHKSQIRKSIEKQYYSDNSGRPFIEIIQIQHKSNFNKCTYCGNVATYINNKNLGSNKYSLCANCNYYPLDFVMEEVLGTRVFDKTIVDEKNKKKIEITYELIKLIERCPKCSIEYTWRNEKIIKEREIPVNT